MKKKAVVLGLVGAMALGTCTVSAANGTKNISATFRNIKIVVDGKELSTSAEPFIYNGTTYLPIRAVGEAVGKEVTWNGGTNTVYLGEVPASAQQQTPAPETPAPAASSSLPILSQALTNWGASKEEIHAMKSLKICSPSGLFTRSPTLSSREKYPSLISARSSNQFSTSPCTGST